MKDIPVDLRCKELIFRAGDSWHQYRCDKKATRDGFCSIHHPDAVKARDANKHSKWAKERAERGRVYAIQMAECEVVNVAKCWARDACSRQALLDAIRGLVELEDAK